MAFTLQMRQAFLRHVFKNAPMPTPPASVLVALLTSVDPLAEVSAPSYSRVRVSCGAPISGAGSGWSDPDADGEVRNLSDLAWPTATTAWGTIRGVALYDAAARLWAVAAADESTPIGPRDQYRVLAGDLKVRFA